MFRNESSCNSLLNNVILNRIRKCIINLIGILFTFVCFFGIVLKLNNFLTDFHENQNVF